MGDDPHQHLPPSDSGDSEEVVSQQDLDALLSEASELAAEIASDVGVEDLDPSDVEALHLGPAPADTSEDLDDTASTGEWNAISDSGTGASPETEADVDKTLDNLDGMISQTQGEIGYAAQDDSRGDEFVGTRLPPVDDVDDERGVRLPRPEAETDPPFPSKASSPDRTDEVEEEDDLMDLAARGPETEKAHHTADLPAVAPAMPENGDWSTEKPAPSYACTDDLTSPPPAETKPASEKPPQASASSVPDFMQELTEPGEDEPDIPASRDNADDLLEPETEAKNSDLKPESASGAAAPASNSASDTPPPKATAAKAERFGALRSVARRVAALAFVVSPLALRLADRAADLLDVANRPVRWLGHGARDALGWLAIATLGTSLLVFLVSLF